MSGTSPDDPARVEAERSDNGLEPLPMRRKLHRFDISMGPEMYAEYAAQSSYLRAAYAAWWSDPRRPTHSGHRDTWPAFLTGWWSACEVAHAALLALTDGPESER